MAALRLRRNPILEFELLLSGESDYDHGDIPLGLDDDDERDRVPHGELGPQPMPWMEDTQWIGSIFDEHYRSSMALLHEANGALAVEQQLPPIKLAQLAALCAFGTVTAFNAARVQRITGLDRGTVTKHFEQALTMLEPFYARHLRKNPHLREK
jgi:hypothetical protein